MSETEPMYTARFRRPRDVWRDFWIESDDVARIEYNPSTHNGLAMLCKKLREMGKPDGDILVIEVGASKIRDGVRKDYGLRHYLPSIYTLSERPEQIVAATETEAKPRTSIIGQSVYNTLMGLRAGTVSGPDLHPVTRASIQKPGYVDAEWKVTADGDAAITRYEEDAAAKAAVKPVEKVTKPKVVVSPKQFDAFLVVTKRPFAWESVNGRTRNSMIEAGWITLKNDTPILTDVGREVWDEVLQQQAATGVVSAA